MPFNPMKLMQMMRNGNPQEMILGMLKRQAGNNPVLNNALNMAEKGDSKGIEQLARNLCKENGVNPDDVMRQIRSQFGMK